MKATELTREQLESFPLASESHPIFWNPRESTETQPQHDARIEALFQDIVGFGERMKEAWLAGDRSLFDSLARKSESMTDCEVIVLWKRMMGAGVQDLERAKAFHLIVARRVLLMFNTPRST